MTDCDEDDVWDNSGDDLEIMKMDRSRIENQMETLGFVDGLEQAKTDQNYQDGFNFGFIESAKVSKKCGWLKGRLTAILIHCQISGEETDGIYEKLFEIDSVKEIIENTKLTAENVKMNETPFTNLESRLNDVEKFILEIE